MTNTVKFLGCNDEQTSCDNCGRDNLKKTVVLDIDGEIVRYGTECAAKTIGRGAKEVRAEAKKVQDEIDQAARAERDAKAQAESERWFAWLNSKSSAASVTEQIQEMGGYSEAKRAYNSEMEKCNV